MRLARSVALVLSAMSSLLSVGLLPRVAVADPAAIKMAERLNKKAMEDYDALEFDQARTTLLSASTKLRESGDDETATAAKVYVSLGMVSIAGSKDRNRAVQQFTQALKIDGTIELDPERATPELQEAFDEAKSKLKPVTKGRGGKTAPRQPKPDETPAEPEPATEAPNTCSAVTGLQHESVDQAKPGEDILIKAEMGSDVEATRLFLFYRVGGQEEFQSEQMTLGKPCQYAATIPGDAVRGKGVQYYLEARDAKGRPAVAAGSAASPYIVSLLRPASVVTDGPDDPLREVRKGKATKRAEEEEAKGRGYGKMFFNLMGGTGIGVLFSGAHTDTAYQYHPPTPSMVGSFQPLTVGSTGIALAPIHGALEVGINITRHVGLSLIGRVASTLTNNAEFPDPLSMSRFGGVTKGLISGTGMARFRYTFLEGRFKPTLHIGVGGGQIRHVLDVTEAGHHVDGNGVVDPPLTDSGTASTYQMPPPSAQNPKSMPQDPKTMPLNKTDPGRFSSAQNNICPTYPDPCIDSITMGFVLAAAGFSLYYDLATFKNGGFGLLLDTDFIFAFGDQSGINIDIQLGIGAHFL